MEKLRVLSLFAGIGGFDLGLERTGGFHTLAVAEVDPYASRILSLRFPDAPNAGDVTTAEYPDADVICAGFPCQDLSYAGAGAGLAGARSGLFWEVVRAARVVRPRLILLENVAALLGRGLDVVLRALAEIGYDAEWHCIPASAVGAPHRRDRIWIVAHAQRSEGGERSNTDLQRGRSGEAEQVGLVGREPISGILASLLSYAQSDGQPLSGTGHEGRDNTEAGILRLWTEPGGDGASDGAGLDAALADAASFGQSGQGQPLQSSGPKATGEGQATHAVAGCLGDQWRVEPNVGRVAHGVPNRVDRLRCLGNGIVPQVAEIIGRAILAREAA